MSDPTFQPPDVEELQALLPNYEIVSFIEAGGMGAVYRARQVSLDREVAIKILPREFGADEELSGQFQAEAKAMAKLNSPNLIGVYDFGVVDGMPYLVMEFVNGKSLHYSSHGQQIDQEAALEIVAGVAEGLEHAHTAGIIHRDIKPANILLNQDAQPKIGDFGLAQPVESDETDAVVYGTPGYTAPEIIQGHAAAPTSDVFSVGVMLYVLLTGDFPASPMVPVHRVVPVDPRIHAIIQKATNPSPAARYQSAGDLAEALRKILSGLGSKRGLNTGPQQGANPIQRTSAPAAQPLAVAPALEPAAPAAGSPAPPSTPPPVVTAPGSNWGFLRNLVIIFVLAGCIFGVWKAIGWKKAESARQEREARELATTNTETSGSPVKTPVPDPTPSPTPPPVEPEPEPEPETVAEALARLRSDLAGGIRDEFPPGTHTRGSSCFLVVDDPLTWAEAARFAEDHGAQLAVCSTNNDLGWLAAKLPANSDAWIGGGTTGRNRWGWVDGSEWELKNYSSLTGTAAALSDLGTVRARSPGTRYPFVMQWHMDGSNPGSLADQLQRSKESLVSPNPVWPPGSVHQDDRHFLVVVADLTWDEAADLAADAGAIIAVPASPEENDLVARTLNTSLPEDTGCWLGGRYNGRAWQWSTGEPWSFAAWRENAPDGDPTSATALRFVTGSGSGWDDADPADKSEARSLLLEWSTDKDRKHEVRAAVPVGPAAETLKRLQALAQRAFEAKQADYEKEIKANSVAFKWELDFWLRGLSGSQQKIYKPGIEAMKARVPDDAPIPTDIPRQAMPVKVAAVYDKHLVKQDSLEEAFLGNLDKLRIAYLEKLTAEAEKLKTAGDRNGLQAIENEIQGIGQDGASFRAHLTGEPLPVQSSSEHIEGKEGDPIIGKWIVDWGKRMVTYTFGSDEKANNGRWMCKGTWARKGDHYEITWNSGRTETLTFVGESRLHLIDRNGDEYFLIPRN